MIITEKRNEFHDLLDPIHISNMSDKYIAKMQIETLRDWIIENTPTKLYRYYSYNPISEDDYNLKNLKNEEIWGSRISVFNDPYECVPCFDLETLVNSIQYSLRPETVKDFINQIRQGVLNPNVKSLITEETINDIANGVEPFRDEEIYRTLQMSAFILLSYIKENLPSLVNTFYWEMKQLQLQRYIACFTENYKASLMWGHYASSHKGFCAEYDFHSVMSKHSDLCQENKSWANFMLDYPVVPIKYSDKRVDATTYLTTIIQSQFIQQSDLPMQPLRDLLIATKCLLTKSTAWGYENEWRLFSPLEKLDGNEHKAMLHIKPTAIYIGVNTPIERAEEIYNICLEKDIPCFKMLQKYTSDDFDLDEEPYEIYRNRYFAALEQATE